MGRRWTGPFRRHSGFLGMTLKDTYLYCHLGSKDENTLFYLFCCLHQLSRQDYGEEADLQFLEEDARCY